MNSLEILVIYFRQVKHFSVPRRPQRIINPTLLFDLTYCALPTLAFRLIFTPCITVFGLIAIGLAIGLITLLSPTRTYHP